MTTHHQVNLSWIGVGVGKDGFGEYISEEQADMDKLLIRSAASAATRSNAVVWIIEKGNGFFSDDDEEPLGAVIPVALAKELIAEGRLNHPPLASMTVVDWSRWKDRHENPEHG